jgi:hypothetical protein
LIIILILVRITMTFLVKQTFSSATWHSGFVPPPPPPETLFSLYARTY